MSTVTYPYIEVAEDGRAYIAGEGFRFKVRMLVEEQLATGAGVEELQQGHPQLSLSQIHSGSRTITTTSLRLIVRLKS